MNERIPEIGLQAQGIETRATLHWNLVTARLIETAVARGEGKLSADGPLVVETGEHTGRSAQDKFMVRDDETRDTVWWGKTNKPMSPDDFAALKADFFAALGQKDELFVADLFGAAINELQHCVGDYFSPAQGGRYTSKRVGEVALTLQELGAACIGQSSWGPTGFALAASEADAQAMVRAVRDRYADAAGLELMICAARNEGAQWTSRQTSIAAAISRE